MLRHAHASLHSVRIALSTVLAGLTVIGLVGIAQAAPLDPSDPSISSSMVLRLDANAITPVADGTAITNWADTSPSGSNPATFTSGGGATAPKYESNQFPSGKPALQFNGTSSVLYEAITGSQMSGPTTWFIVYQQSAAVLSFQALMTLDNGTATPTDSVLLYAGFTDTISMEMNYTTASSTRGIPENITATTPHTLAFSYSGGTNGSGTYQANFDETTPAVGSSGGIVNFTATNGAIGARYNGSLSGFFNGDIAEIIIYDSALSAPQIAGVQEYLTDKWLIVPEPASAALLLVGVVPLLRRRRRA